MKIVGLTGGIGSGKTTVARMFEDLGVAVYYADDAAKYLLEHSKIVRRHMIQLLGKTAYIDTKPNRPFIAKKIFNDTDLLAQVNKIIHPKVAAHFKRWVKKQKGTYCIKEAAILFESGSYKECDAIILVTAPQKLRLQRVTERDGVTKQAVLDRMKNQWSDEEKIPLSNFIIENIDLDTTQKEVKRIHKMLV